MIDVDDTLRAELNRLVPIDARRDWNEIVARAGLKRERALRLSAIGSALLVAAALLAVTTPLGATLVRSLDDFSAWLTGEPGTPASEREQQEFEAANARSWLRFPEGTRLRHLITTKAAESTVELYGFRSGTTALCLRISVKGETPSTTQECAPLAELKRAGGPARVVIVDYPVGEGEKVAWYGLDRFQSPAFQVTAGITTDAVRSVVLEDDAGRHEVSAVSNAFLYVAEQPEVGQRVKGIWARTDAGLVALPFAPARFPFGAGDRDRPPPAAPALERRVQRGRIAWLDAREPRGDSMDALPQGFGLGQERGENFFGRVLTPDPNLPIRLLVTLNARPDGPGAGLCIFLIIRGGGGGGCLPHSLLFRQAPIRSSLFLDRGTGAFATLSGLVSDDVARVEALLANGERAEVALKDNAFIVVVSRAKLPSRLVAYDTEERVIGFSNPWRDNARSSGPARGRPTSLIRVAAADGAKAELFVGPSTDGGECMFKKEFVDPQHGGVGTNCQGPIWSGPPLQVGTSWSPPRFVSGRARPDIRSVRIRFADGSATTLTPTRGYILWAVPEEHLGVASGPVAAEGLRADGSVVATQSLRPPPATRSRRSSSRD